jgi:2-succinyl-5-enolpyruvyl-6-hydroxy-3-cyclohexene-1-carboxylate synthase
VIVDAVNNNQFMCELLVEELVRLGVRTYFVSPGSRSSPLVVAAGQHPETRCIVHFDERGSAFSTLGFGRVTSSPAAWITTSGTAVANGRPAVVEASADGVPMLLLTADRPPELRKTGANQTIDQPDIFSDFVRWKTDLPAPDRGVDPLSILTTVDQAVHRATADRGPVHLNCMFREPLAPATDPTFVAPVVPALRRWLDSTRPFTTYDAVERGISEPFLRSIVDLLQQDAEGLVVAGRLGSAEEGELVLSLAKQLGWALLPDVLSFVRNSDFTSALAYYDLLLAADAYDGNFQVRTVLHFGGRATSKRLYEHLEQNPPDNFVLVSATRDRIDPIHRVTHRIEADVVTACRQLSSQLATAVSAGNRDLIAPTHDTQKLSRTDRVLDDHLSTTADVSEPWLARYLSRNLSRDHELFLGSSMPIRDMDSFAAPSDRLPARANRGGSGIDGTVASAVGVAMGRSGPVTVLLGDLALLHDLNSLSLVRSCERPVVVIVINNDGGGIFSFLPIAGYPSVFEQYFGTPHGLHFESAAAMFGLSYRFADTKDSVAAAYTELCESGAGGIIEIRTTRDSNLLLHNKLIDAVRVEFATSVESDAQVQMPE